MLDKTSKFGQKCARLFGLETAVDQAFLEDRNREEEKNFFQYALPYRTFDEESEIFQNKQSMGFCIEVAPLIGVYEFFAEEFSSFISEVGEEQDSIQSLLWADHRVDPLLEKWIAPRKAKGGIYKKMSEKRALLFKETIRSQKDCPPTRDFRFFFSYSSPKGDLEKMKSKQEQALSFFKRLSSARILHPQAFIETFSGLVNFSADSSIYARKYNPWNYLPAAICMPGGVKEEDSHLSFNTRGKEAQFKAFEVLEYPSEWDSGATQNLLGDFFNPERGIFGDFFFHYGIFFPSHEKEANRLKLKSASLEKQLRFKSLKNFFGSAEREYEETLFSQKELLEGKKLVQTRLTLGLFAPPPDMMNIEGNLKALWAKMGFKIAPCDRIHCDEFVRCLPMTWGESESQHEIKLLRSFKTTTTHETGLFVPISAEWGGNSHTGMPLFGRRGQFAPWDLFSTDGNFNTVVVGASGTGKSVFMEEILSSLLGVGGRAFVLDLGRSFENLCGPYGGQHLFFSEKSNFKLNPFALIPEGADAETTDAALGMVASILATMAMPMEKIDTERENMLNIAAKKAAHIEGATIDTVISILERSNYKTERMKGKSESLIDALEKYTTTGEYRKFFYGENEISFQSDFVVIETEELKNKGDLQAVILQIFSLLISTEVFMGNREKRSLICIDEAWDLLKSPQMGGFIESMARRLRKYNGALLVGTQSLQDFDRSSGAAAAFQNSNWLVMLGKDGNTLPYIKEKNIFELTPPIEHILSSLKKKDGTYSEAFIHNKSSGFCTLGQLRLDPFSAYLYSTNAENFKAIQDLTSQGYTTEEAVEKLVAEGGAV